MFPLPHTPVPDWARALASAKPGARYRITDLVLTMVRDRCRELGLAEDEEVECIDNRSWAVHLERSDGRRVMLERDYAWFIGVELVDALNHGKSADPGGLAAQ